MSPLQINILLHYHAHVDDYCGKHFSSAAKEFIEEFLRNGMLRENTKSDQYSRLYELSDRGKAYVRALMEVPLPQCVWRINWPAIDGEL